MSIIIFVLSRSIRRIIFFSLVKPNVNDKGEKEMEVIAASQALQIAGRAGRFGTQFEKVRGKQVVLVRGLAREASSGSARWRLAC